MAASLAGPGDAGGKAIGRALLVVQVRRGCTAVFPSWAVQWRYCAWRCPWSTTLQRRSCPCWAPPSSGAPVESSMACRPASCPVSARVLNVLSTTSLGHLFMSTMLSGDSVRQPGHALSLMRLTCSRFLSDWGVTGWSSTGPDSLVAVCAGTLGCCRNSNCEHVWSLWGSRACAGGPHEGEAVALCVIII